MSDPDDLRYSATVTFRGDDDPGVCTFVGWGRTRSKAIDHAHLQATRRWPGVEWHVKTVSTIDSVYADLMGRSQLPHYPSERTR